MSALLDLAAKVEALTGPCRETDEAIMEVLFRRENRMIGTQESQDDGSWAPVAESVWVDPCTDKWVSTAAREFTASLDAAMTLVPERFKWRLGYSRHVPHCAELVDYDKNTGRYDGNSDYSRALALTAAALRARAAISGASS